MLPTKVYFGYVLGDLIKESTQRVEQLDHLELAYLLKGLTNLRTYIGASDELTLIEKTFRTQLLELLTKGDPTKVRSVEPYSASKLLRYLLAYDQPLDRETDQLYEIIATKLIMTMEARDAALQKSDVKDSLIDLEMQDVVDVLRVYSAIAAFDNDF